MKKDEERGEPSDAPWLLWWGAAAYRERNRLSRNLFMINFLYWVGSTISLVSVCDVRVGTLLIVKQETEWVLFSE